VDRKIVRVGNSYGIVLTKSVLRLAGFDKRRKVKLNVARGKIILTSSPV